MSKAGTMPACFIGLIAMLAAGCSIEHAPVVVEGKLIDRAGNASTDLPIDASAIRRRSKVIMGAPVSNDQTTRDPRYVTVIYKPEGCFSAQAYDANALVLSVPGHRIRRKDVSSTSPQRAITFYRSTSGVLLEITPDD